ncbi:MAG: M20/M25/M40 family metallo-hydrolase [Clostridia bacterium]|nr:M20/M25/M40 family metallo-hydrolase [Clostridia bacterium]
MDVEKILQTIESDWPEHLGRVQRYVSQPSVSATGQGMREMAAMLMEDLKVLGCQKIELIETPNWPVVYAHLDVGAPKTIIFYGMYDVQPADEPNWTVDPFAGTVVEDPDLGPVVMSRGVTNQKGPLAATLNALTAIKKVTGTLPFNAKFVVEGEEEMASVDLPEVLEKLRPELEGCDCCYFAHYGQDAKGKVMHYLGTKGVIYMKLKIKGGDWGAPIGDSIHGSNAIWIDNPVWNMVHLLESLKDKDEKVLVEGFYDDVAGPLPGDEEVLAELLKTLDQELILKSWNTKKFKLGMNMEQAMRRYFFTPELNICGIEGGYTEEGTKTLLPHEVHVNIDIRTVPNMDPKKVIRQLDAHFEKLGMADKLEVQYFNGYNWQRSGLYEPQIKAMLDAIEELGIDKEVWVTLAGSAPFSLFQSMFNIPCVFGGLGHGGRVHSVNEYATVQGIKDMEKSIVLFLRNLMKE